MELLERDSDSTTSDNESSAASQSLIQSASDDGLESSGSAASSEGIVNAVTSILSSEGIMTFDIRTNALIVTDYPEILKRVDEIIAGLDKKIDQVLIKAEIIELSDTISNILGIKYGDLTTPGRMIQGTYTSPTVGGLAYPFNNSFFGQDELLNSVALSSRGNLDDLDELGTVFGTLSAGSFSVVMDAIKTSNKGKFLSRPRIMTLDNEPAVVDITADTAVSATTTVDESGNVNTSYEREETGILLRVTPQIHVDDSVTMLVQPSVTRTAASSQFPTAALDPFTRSVLTKVRIHQGDTISIGGLLQNDLAKVNQKVPFR